jgi:putative membrane protein
MSSVDLSLLIALLHGYYDGPFLLAWDFDPLVTTGLLVAVSVYWWAWRRVQASGERLPPSWYAWSFAGGIGFLAFSLLGPLETYNENLFTLHMAQHLIIMQIATPMILLGRPVHLLLRAMAPRTTKQTVSFLFGKSGPRYLVLAVTAPIIAFVLFNGNLGLWHLPMFYDAALRGEWVHHFQHILFAGFAMIYWWTIIDPVPRHHRILEVWAMGSVFLSMMISSIIGAIITLSNSVLYSFYLEAANPWGWSPLVDQQVGGLIMWVGSFFLYLIVLFALLAKLLQRDELNAELEVQRARAREQAATTS